MATLVLTTVGGLVGGPVGAALGAAIGQTVDRAVLFKPKGRQGPRLTELAVQTSSYGRPIPRLFGRMRVAGQVVWATDLVEHRARQGGGKGQPSVTSYSYSASFAVLLSARPIVGVGRIWADGNLLRGEAGDWKTATGFRLYLGSEDQAPDPLIASAEGLGLAPAHRGSAYAVFEDLALETFGNRIPSLTFEVIADATLVMVGSVAREIAEGAIVGVGPAMSIDGFSAYGDSARAVIETLAEVSGAWFAPGSDGLTMRAGGSPARTIVDEGRMRRIAPATQVPKSIAVAHYDPARDWQAGVQRAGHAGGAGKAPTIDVPIALSAAAARAVAEAMLLRAENARTTRRIDADVIALDVAPGDIVSIAGEGGAWRVAAIAIERHRVSLDLVALAAAPPATPASGGRVLRAPDAPVGTTIIHAFETPMLDDMPSSTPRVSIVAAGTAVGWRRAAVQYSLDDGASWIAAGGTRAPGVIGSVTAPVPAGSATLIDRRTSIHVALAHSGMTLANADAAALDQGANLALVGEELLQFGTATYLGGADWRLSELWRGRRGTIAGASDAGSRFVLLEEASMIVLAVCAEPGARVLVSASGTGDISAAEAEVVMTGASVLPLAPVHLRAMDTPEGISLTWRRRSRVDWRWRDGVGPALGEEREAYGVAVTDGDGGTRLFEPREPGLVFAGEVAGALSVAVRQLGTNGVSHPAVAVI